MTVELTFENVYVTDASAYTLLRLSICRLYVGERERERERKKERERRRERKRASERERGRKRERERGRKLD